MSKLLFKCGDEWTPEIIENAWVVIEEIAKELKTTYYKPQLEIVSAKQQIDILSSIGLPIYYKHWSFGKQIINNEKAYNTGKMGLAYELVINSDPCIAYLMEENNALVQTLVVAHASIGHSAVFKNNYLFKENTDASAIIDYLSFAKSYLKKCEDKYGQAEVEDVLDACHALQNYGVDKYKKSKKTAKANEAREAKRFEHELQNYDHVWKLIGEGAAERNKADETPVIEESAAVLSEPQENILYFLEKKSPYLPAWKREIIRIVRKIAEYFSPQSQTKVLNEGYASFVHHYILNRMYDEGYLDAGSMIEMYALHSGVLNQRALGHFNPYKLGFVIFSDIKRLCEGGEWIKEKWVPVTDEDRRYFPRLIGQDWATAINYAMENFKDETFIQQYLSPKVARDLQLIAINDPGLSSPEFQVTDIANESGFEQIRQKLAAQYATANLMPDIQVVAVDTKGSRKLVLEHFVKNDRPLNTHDAQLVLKYVADLWGYDVELITKLNHTSDSLTPITFIQHGKFSEKVKESKSSP